MIINPIDRAAAACGGAQKFMDALGIKRRTFFKWKSEGVPVARAIQINKITGIPLHELNGDFPSPVSALNTTQEAA